MRLRHLFLGFAFVSFGFSAVLAEVTPLSPTPLRPMQVTEWKAVYGQVESRDRVPARARLGGGLVDLSVVEGDLVTAGQVIGRIEDQKLAFQMTALGAQQGALGAQLGNAKAELARGESLLKQGVATAQGLDALRTQVQVLAGQLAALSAEGDVLAQQITEGTVLAPTSGRVLDVPVSKGAVVMPGEAVATVAGGGTFLRLQIPERHAGALHEGDAIEVLQGDVSQTGPDAGTGAGTGAGPDAGTGAGPDAGTGAGTRTGILSRLYPLIQNGRVQADVELAGLSDAFVDARVLVRLPVGQREALMVPASALQSRAGLDFVTVQGSSVQGSSGPASRAVVPGEAQGIEGILMVEILSGLQVGDVLVETADE